MISESVGHLPEAPNFSMILESTFLVSIAKLNILKDERMKRE